MTDNNAVRDLLLAEFDNGEVLQFQGRGGRTFDYIEDETVMDRLDEVLGIGATSFTFEVVSETCVKGTLIVLWPGTAERSQYQDFGYATRADSAEPLKEAVSDAIRRLGRYVGVARYLYRKHETVPQARQNTPQRPVITKTVTTQQRYGSGDAAPPPRPTVTVSYDDVPEEPEDLFPPIGSAATAVPVDQCPIHRVPWAGGPGDYWHKDADGKYCRHPDNVKRSARRAS